jgi:hypothetical protein
MCRRRLCENFLYGFKAAPTGPLAPPARTAQPGSRCRSRPAGLWRRPAGAKGKGTGPLKPGKSRSRGGFDTGTPRGGSIGLMRATLERPPDRGQAYSRRPRVKSAAPSAPGWPAAVGWHYD